MSSSSHGASRLPAASETMALYFSPSVPKRVGWLMTRTRGWSNTNSWAG